MRGVCLRPTPEQTRLLEVLQAEVFDGMGAMAEWQGHDLTQLRRIPLGVLRRGTVRRHGVTRWVRGARPNRLEPHEVRVIDLHPRLLDANWWPYARFVLHHELIHATGHRWHDATFRRWEAAWPSPSEDEGAEAFAHMLHMASARWWWTCPACDVKHARQRRANGRYICRRCGQVLQDMPAQEVDE